MDENNLLFYGKNIVLINNEFYFYKENKIINNKKTYIIMSYEKIPQELLYLLFEDEKTKVSTNMAFKILLEKNAALRKNMVLGVFDLDDFKSINDTYGHATGDEMLAVVANFFKHNLKEKDLISRFGGDEFIICLIDIDIELAYIRLKEIMNKINNGIYLKNGMKYRP